MENNDWLEETPIYKKPWFIITVILLIVVTLILFIPNKKSNEQIMSSDTSNYTPKVSTPTCKWEYSSKIDEMENMTIYYAECFSDNTILFGFPYEQKGGSTFDLILRKNTTFDIMLQVSKGHFMSGNGNRIVKLKFDNEKPFTVSYNSPSDGSIETIFLNNTTKILKHLKNANKLKLEVEFYDYGKQIIEFTVNGLKWDHK